VDPTTYGFPSYLTANSKKIGLPLVVPGEMQALGGDQSERDFADRIEGKADLTWVRGNTRSGFGSLWGHTKYYFTDIDYATGVYVSDRSFSQGPDPLVFNPSSGFGFASFLLGSMSYAQHNYQDWEGNYRQWYYGLYSQMITSSRRN